MQRGNARNIPFPFNTVGLILFAFLLLCSGAISLFIFEHRRERERVLESVQGKFIERYQALDQALLTTARYVELLRNWATSRLENRGEKRPSTLFRFNPEGDYFELPGGEGKGNVFGVGLLTGREAPFYRDFDLAVELLPLFKAVQEENEAVLLGYFFSDLFISSGYPAIPIKMLIENTPGDTLRDAFEVFYTPHSGRYTNPERLSYWTDIYMDRSGYGLMVTRAAPLYEHDRFVGLLAVDITLGFLKDFTTAFEGPQGRLLLVTDGGEVLADSIYTEEKTDSLPLLSERLPPWLKDSIREILQGDTRKLISGYHVFSRKLVTAPWTFIYLLSDVDLSAYLYLSQVTLAILAVVLLISLLLIFFAVRERRAAQAKLASEHKYREVFNTTGEAIFIHNADSGAILEVNKAMLEMYGYEQSEVAGLKVEDLSSGTPPFSKEKADVHIRKAADEGPQLFEWTARRKNGESFWAEVLLRHARIGGKERILAVVRDISRRKAAEEELTRYRERLEQLVEERTADLKTAQEKLVEKERLATLGKLTATVSHELRNPLGTISASLFTISERVEGKNLNVEQPLERSRRNIRRCTRIIEELLDFTRTQPLHLERIDLDRWLAEILEEFTLPEEISLKQHLTFGSTINIDRDRLRRCVINILANAVQAILSSDRQGKKAWISVQTCTSDKKAEIRVADSGPGVTEDNLVRIFEPLYSTKSFGIGLGLPIVRQIMEAHGGGVEIESKPGKGATVVLRLPLKDAADI